LPQQHLFITPWRRINQRADRISFVIAHTPSHSFTLFHTLSHTLHTLSFFLKHTLTLSHTLSLTLSSFCTLFFTVKFEVYILSTTMPQADGTTDTSAHIKEESAIKQAWHSLGETLHIREPTPPPGMEACCLSSPLLFT
jgi:hypothetical protein